ncbi:hypothetical protein ACH5RR_001535 [Cinchona calisaya]|uniref:BHLH domain-containing protein n=1 Tax=Cinchona calisaya TaxID=153742 RepID=A0ABD3B3S5_9GENT
MDNLAATSWFSELGILEDPFLNDQCDIMDFFDEDISSVPVEGNSSFSTTIPTSNSTSTLCVSSAMELAPPIVIDQRLAKRHKTNEHNYLSNIHNDMPNFDQSSSSSSIILTFGNPNMPEINPQQVTLGTLNPEDNDAVSEVLTSHGSFVNLGEATKTTVQAKTKKTIRPPSQTYDHIIAERKRREQLSRLFMALSAIVPGLKKMDKTSVLGDAIKYLKHLQERVNTLEEQAAKQTMESVVLVKRSQLILLEDEGSSDETGGGPDEQPLPEIEAKICDKNVLLRIHCENHKGVLIKIFSEVDKLDLAITSISVAPFGSLTLDITIIAEMEKEFNLTIKELVECLRSTLQQVKQSV